MNVNLTDLIGLVTGDQSKGQAQMAPEVKDAVRAQAATGQSLDLGQILQLVAILKALWDRFRPSTPPPVTPPVEPPVTPPVPPIGTQPPVTPPVTPPPVQGRRKIVSFRPCHWIGWESFDQRPGEKHAYHHLIGNPQAIIQGQELVGRGYRGHVDMTPIDQYGQPFFNDDIPKYPEQFAKEPSLISQDGNGRWTCGEGNNRIRHYITVSGGKYGPMGDTVPGDAWKGQDICGLTSETDDAGMTPVVLINYDVPLSVEIPVSYSAEYEGPDGTIISVGSTSTVRVKAWEVVGQEP